MGFEPTNGSLGSYCLTTWLHPRKEGHYSDCGFGCQATWGKRACCLIPANFRYNVIIPRDFQACLDVSA